MKKKRWMALGVALCLTFTLSCPALAAEFSDAKGHWAESAITQVADYGIFQGTSATEFSPNQTMTRGMFVTALGRAAQYLGLNITAKASANFTDVAATQYYAPYVAWANENGIVNGVSATQFAPATSVTREQMCAMFIRFLTWAKATLPGGGSAQTAFLDGTQISQYAIEAVGIASNLKLIQGTTTTNGVSFYPRNHATRAEVATVFSRLIAQAGTLIPGGTVNPGGPTQEELQQQAVIVGYFETMVKNYQESSMSSPDPKVQACVEMLMGCMQDAVNHHNNGQLLTKAYIQTQYATEIAQAQQMYQTMSQAQITQFGLLILQLESLDHLMVILDYFGINY